MKHLSPLLLFILPVSAGDIVPPPSTSGGWEWNISVGPSVRNIGSLKINAGSRSGDFILPSLVGESSLVPPPIGEEDEYGDRFYDNGYVRQDEGTSADGSTWYWGHDSAAQVQGDNLMFSASGTQSVVRDTTSDPRTGSFSKDSLSGFSPHVQVDLKSPHTLGGFRVGFSGSFDFTKVDQSLAFSDFSASQLRDNYRLDYTDMYSLGGVVPPSAPYAGSFGGPGPLIGNLPSTRIITPVLLSSDSAAFTNTVFASFDMDVSSLALGPTFSRSWGPLELALQSGLILNLYRWEGHQSEQLKGTNTAGTTTVARWSEKDSGTKFRTGVYAQADLGYDLTDLIGITAFTRFDTAGEFRAQVGPSIMKVDPGGLSAGFQIRYSLP